MFKFLKTAALSALLGATVLGAVPASAQSGIYLGLGGGHSQPQVGVYLEDGHSYRRNDQRHDRYEDRFDRRDDRFDRRDDRVEYRACSAGQALNKAERMGLRRARVVDVGRRSIEVAGRARGDYVVISFSRRPGCPILR
ncbi:MAG: hypothetical protein Q8Q62_16040 [Mesorhizobium sp.]|nr:hypothetical protein [Mesorhizobium sp.]